MSFEMESLYLGLIQKQAVLDLEKCNDFTVQFGLTLSHHDAVELVETRTLALKMNGRIEFGGGVIEKIIKVFCNSPYLSQHNYVEILHDLTEIFYYYKNETLDLMSDEDLIRFMKYSFDNICQGSLELLSGRELYNLARNLRFGNTPEYLNNLADEEDEEDEEDEY
ncbi:DUF6323 family protein [Desulfitobacterium sp. AusDCA]|uniref:DUF6323 family protein n=1 Tax=Desulfitobacterium sp. AusDCA TaxID=3240383 RepID=UPI003DA6DA9E